MCVFVFQFGRMFLVDWIWGLLSSLGLANKSGKLVFLGLDAAGKTTLLNMLRDGRVQAAPPTLYPSALLCLCLCLCLCVVCACVCVLCVCVLCVCVLCVCVCACVHEAFR